MYLKTTTKNVEVKCKEPMRTQKRFDIILLCDTTCFPTLQPPTINTSFRALPLLFDDDYIPWSWSSIPSANHIQLIRSRGLAVWYSLREDFASAVLENSKSMLRVVPGSIPGETPSFAVLKEPGSIVFGLEMEGDEVGRVWFVLCVKPRSCRQRDAPQDHSFACGVHVS
jgi:hypothetical protein